MKTARYLVLLANCLILVQTAPAAATFTVTTTAPDGPGSFSQAIRDANASSDPVNTIAFNIQGAGPHYINPPPGGFPLLTKDNTTIDGYTQPGSSPNTNPITQSNNAVIKIVLDARGTNNNLRDMAYVFYGTLTTSDPPINNSSMAGSPPGTSGQFERGGFTPGSISPYVPEEVAILGIYRATNVTIRGLAFLGDYQTSSANGLSEYAVAVAIDYGLDTSVKDRLAYDEGSCRGFHINGCWIGVDPATREKYPSAAAIAAFRHRDKGTGGTRPELPNMENMVIGVKPGSSNPRAEFNVLHAAAYTIAGEGIRCRVSGNQLLDGILEIGRYDDTQVPSIVIGTDGDGVNDADEGNLFPNSDFEPYNTGNKVYVMAGNIFGLDVDGSRPGVIAYAVDGFNFSQRTKVQFGSNLDGQSDAEEANWLYGTFGLGANANAPDNNAWISLRGNVLVGNQLPLPLDETAGLNLFNKFIDTSSSSITPAITSVTTTSLSGICGLPLPGVAQVVIDVYEADPEGETLGTTQGRVYRGSFTDNSPADSDPTVGAFTFNIASLGLTSGTKITITANYLKQGASPTISSIARSGNNTTLALSGGMPPYQVWRASNVTGPWTKVATTMGSTVTIPDSAATSFYRISGVSYGQTSTFSASATVP
jgi:hypothetical protein